MLQEEIVLGMIKNLQHQNRQVRAMEEELHENDKTDRAQNRRLDKLEREIR
jgi:hypothetical protein